jgi:hypothetical protein
MIIKQKGFEMCFKEGKRSTVTKRLWEAVPEFGGQGTEGPATQGGKSGAGDSQEILIR